MTVYTNELDEQIGGILNESDAAGVLVNHATGVIHCYHLTNESEAQLLLQTTLTGDEYERARMVAPQFTSDGFRPTQFGTEYSLPITTGDENPMAHYLRLQPSAQNRTNINTLSLEPNSHEQTTELANGVMLQSSGSRVVIENNEADGLLEAHDPSVFAIQEMLAIQGLLNPRQEAIMAPLGQDQVEYTRYADPEDVNEEPPFSDRAFSTLLLFITDEDRSRDEYILGWDRSGGIVLRTFGHRYEGVSVHVQYSVHHPDVTPARRAVNLMAAQALARGRPVFAPPHMLPLCRGENRDAAPHPLSEARPWLLATESGRAMVVADQSRLNDRILREDRLTVFALTPVEVSRHGSSDAYTHILRLRDPRSTDELLRLDYGGYGRGHSPEPVWFYPPRT